MEPRAPRVRRKIQAYPDDEPGIAGVDLLIGEADLLGHGVGPQKAGFRHVRDVEENGLPHRLMRRDRPHSDGEA